MNNTEQIIATICATAEILGTDMKPANAVLMASDLAAYPFESVMAALHRCRRELTGRLTLAAIIQRIEALDGRPEPSEAWGLAIAASDESQTVVWTTEIQQAYGAAESLLEAGDKVGGRMAFIDTYSRLVAQARANGEAVRWQVSLGTDREQRQHAIEKAARLGYLTHEQAERHLLIGIAKPLEALPAPTFSRDALSVEDQAILTMEPRDRLAYLIHKIDTTTKGLKA